MFLRFRLCEVRGAEVAQSPNLNLNGYEKRGTSRTVSGRQWYSRSEKDMATTSVEKEAVVAAAKLLRSMGATQVFIFGSASRGELRSDSDIDLAVTGLPSQVYFSAVSKASDLLCRPVDLVDLDDPTPLVRYLRGSGELILVP